MATGNEHTIVMDSNGDVWGCGSDFYIGNKLNIIKSNTWKLVKKNAAHIYAGDFSSYVVTRKGNIFVTGSNIYGAIGAGDLFMVREKWLRLSLPSHNGPWMETRLFLSPFCSSVIYSHQAQFYITSELARFSKQLETKLLDYSFTDCQIVISVATTEEEYNEPSKKKTKQKEACH